MTRGKGKSSIRHSLDLTCGLFLLALFIVLGRDIFLRTVYRFTGSTQTWEEETVEEGFFSETEEYYYDHLSEDLQEAYREIYLHLMRDEDMGAFYSPVGTDGFWQAFNAVLADHPEIFWVNTSVQMEESSLSKTVVGYQFEVAVPQEDRDKMREELEAAADACISQIPSEASDYEKIKYVFEFIIDTTEYDAQSADSQNIQSVLLSHASVCAGYSRTFEYILHRMGMFCTYISGTIRGGGDHGWNMVRIDDAYYYVDVTWGDPVFSENMDGYDTEDTINYTYLCCTEQDLFKTHVPAGDITLPECTSDAYDYYKLNGCYYEIFDREIIAEALMNSVWSQERKIQMKFGSDEAYELAQQALFEEGLTDEATRYLMKENGVTNWNFRYHTDDNFCLITIYWS